MSQQIRNVIKPRTFEVIDQLETKEVTPEILDSLEQEFYDLFQDSDIKIGRKGIREIMVEVILHNFGTQAFGVQPTTKGVSVISDKAVRKYKKARKNGFNTL